MIRVVEVALATSAFGLTAPLTLCAAALISLDGGGPIFRQQRVGLNRREFRVYKLRTMRRDVVTPIGRWLRATGIDELPQLVNVLRGDMALVGPRPLTRKDVARLGWDRVRFDARWSVKPGITGTAQLHSSRCDRRVSWVYDHAYAGERNTFRDLGVLAATGLCALVGKKHVRRVLRTIGR